MALHTSPLFCFPLRKFLGLGASKADKPVQSRTLLFQLVESELCVADALLDLEDIAGCDQHLAVALQHTQKLRGPENLLMHHRATLLREKRAAYSGAKAAAVRQGGHESAAGGAKLRSSAFRSS